MTTQGRRALAIKILIRQLDFFNEELRLVVAEPGQEGRDTNEVADEEAPAVEELLDSGWEIDVG